MQTRQLVSLVTVIAIIALALGTTIGYSISSGKTTTLMATHIQTKTITAYVTSIQSTLTYSTQSAETLTEIISLSVNGVVTQYVIGTCTGGGEAYVSMTSTSYIEPVNATGYFNATIVTISNSTYVGTEYLTTITTTITGTTCPIYG